MADDLLPEARPLKYKRLRRIRDSHRMVARLLVLGLGPGEVAKRLGYSPGTLTRLQADPAFQELMAQYRAEVDHEFLAGTDDYFELLRQNAIAAERMLSDRLAMAEEDEELLSTRELISISRDGADRIGYGRRSTQVNVNLDFAAKLDAAINRSKSAGQVLADPSPRPGAPLPRLAPPTATMVPGMPPEAPTDRPPPPQEPEILGAQAPMRRKI